MFVESIKCDQCGKELITDTKYPHKFSLELSVIDTNRNSSGVEYLAAMFPPFEGKLHFCDGMCLWEYSNEKLK